MNRRIITTQLFSVALLLSTASMLIVNANPTDKKVEAKMDKAKEQFKEAGSDVKDATHHAKEGLKTAGSAALDKTKDVAKKADDTAHTLKEKIQEKAEQAKDTIVNTATAVKDKTVEYGTAAKDKTADLATAAKDKVVNTAYDVKEKAIEIKDQTGNFISRIAQKTKTKFNDLFKEVDPVENPATVSAIEYRLVIAKPDHSLATPVNDERAQALLEHIIPATELQKRVADNGIRTFDYDLRTDVAEELTKLVHNPHAQITITIHREGILSKLS
jgi:hypothetical protein